MRSLSSTSGSLAYRSVQTVLVDIIRKWLLHFHCCQDLYSPININMEKQTSGSIAQWNLYGVIKTCLGLCKPVHCVNVVIGRVTSTLVHVCSSISEEEPGPLRSDTEGKGVTKVSRTFSYLKNKMYKKTRVSRHSLLSFPLTRRTLKEYSWSWQCLHNWTARHLLQQCVWSNVCSPLLKDLSLWARMSVRQLHRLMLLLCSAFTPGSALHMLLCRHLSGPSWGLRMLLQGIKPPSLGLPQQDWFEVNSILWSQTQISTVEWTQSYLLQVHLFYSFIFFNISLIPDRNSFFIQYLRKTIKYKIKL